MFNFQVRKQSPKMTRNLLLAGELARQCGGKGELIFRSFFSKFWWLNPEKAPCRFLAKGSTILQAELLS